MLAQPLGQYGQPIELIIIRYQFTQNQDTDTYTVHKNYDYTLNYIDIEGSMFRNITYSNRRNFLLFLSFFIRAKHSILDRHGRNYDKWKFKSVCIQWDFNIRYVKMKLCKFWNNSFI